MDHWLLWPRPAQPNLEGPSKPQPTTVLQRFCLHYYYRHPVVHVTDDGTMRTRERDWLPTRRARGNNNSANAEEATMLAVYTVAVGEVVLAG